MMSDRLNSLLKLFEQDPDDSFLSYGIARRNNDSHAADEMEDFLDELK